MYDADNVYATDLDAGLPCVSSASALVIIAADSEGFHDSRNAEKS